MATVPRPSSPSPNLSLEVSELANVRIIIADDESVIRMDLREMLANMGYLIVGEASDGRSAVNLARELNRTWS